MRKLQAAGRLAPGKPTLSTLVTDGVRWTQLRAVGVDFREINALGVVTVAHLPSIMDALDVADDGNLTTELTRYFGRQAVLDTFLKTPNDAVSLAASHGAAILQISLTELLACCKGAPAHAAAVIKRVHDS
eukprot:7376479-Prymnesium_polylepis.1